MKITSHGLFLALALLLLVVLACDLSGGPAIKDYGQAAELYGDYWFHVKRPLTVEGLEGRVVLVGVWRFT